jgi:hypothetical protein
MSYSANDNQNFFVLQNNGRTTSRVLNRPGGNCSISLGGWTEEELEQQRLKREQAMAAATTTTTPQESGTTVPSAKENVTNKTDDGTAVVPSTKVVDEEAGQASPAAPAADDDVQITMTTTKPSQGVSSNAFASSSTTNSFNVLTDRPTSRVLRPPGGHTSIRLG